MGKKEFKVGDIIRPLGKDVTLKVVEQSGCKGCYYENNRAYCNKRYSACSSVYRKDGKSVIFKQIDKDLMSEETAQKLNIDFNKIKNDMETKEVKITVPKGYEIDKEKSTYTNIVFKKKEDVVRTWEDLCKYHKLIPNSSYIVSSNDCKMYDVVNGSRFDDDKDRNFFIDKKHAKSALAMAMISQLMPYYGGAITNEEWGDRNVIKYTIIRSLNEVAFLKANCDYNFLSFHTDGESVTFYLNNKQLVKDYLMIE